MTFAPIAIFIFNRPDHVAKMLKSLAACPEFAESPLYIFCDGPRWPQEIDQVNSARGAARSVLGNRGSIVEHRENRGLANSIISGVTELCERYGRAIVLEDDLLVDPSFLRFMNAALDQYERDDRIMQISGHAFYVPEFERRETAVVLPFGTSWGWATWRRAWQRFDPACAGCERLKTDHVLRRRFNLDGAFEYYRMLQRQLQGRSDSWAIRWYWAIFRDDGLVVYPPRSLVVNIGFDGTGTHGWRSARRVFRQQAHRVETTTTTLPEYAQVDAEDYRLVKKAVSKLGGGLLRAVRRVLRPS